MTEILPSPNRKPRWLPDEDWKAFVNSRPVVHSISRVSQNMFCLRVSGPEAKWVYLASQELAEYLLTLPLPVPIPVREPTHMPSPLDIDISDILGDL